MLGSTPVSWLALACARNVMRKESRWAARRSKVLVGELDVREARRALDTGQEGRHKNCVECVVGEAAELH